MKRRLIATALSTLLPGLGQFFLGRKRKGTFSFIALIAISTGFWPLRLPQHYRGLLFLLWACLLLSLFAVFDALLARDASLPRVSRWWIFAGIPVSYLGANIIFTALLLGCGFHTLKFGSSSMEPTIFLGDKFVADERYYRHQAPRRGDLVLVRRLNSVTVKRIIAIGGDTIEGRNRQILLNGQPQKEPFIQHEFGTRANPNLDTFGPAVIPAGKFFVMGDNRDVSLDSRTPEFGLVDASGILGKPLYGYRIVGHPLSWNLN